LVEDHIFTEQKWSTFHDPNCVQMKMRCEVNWLFVRSSSCLQSNKGNQIWLYCFTVFSWVKNKYVYL